MRQLARVTVTMQELDRLKCIEAVVQGDLPPIRAAERLGLTTRQVRRLAIRYRHEGPIGLISKRRNRPSNNRLDPGLEEPAGGPAGSSQARQSPRTPAVHRSSRQWHPGAPHAAGGQQNATRTRARGPAEGAFLLHGDRQCQCNDVEYRSFCRPPGARLPCGRRTCRSKEPETDRGPGGHFYLAQTWTSELGRSKE